MSTSLTLTSSASSASSSSSSSSSSASSTTPFSVPPERTFTPQPTPSNGGVGPPDGSQQNNTNGTIATSASLYLYTFLATLVLLLSVSAAIVIRSFVLRRRHRLMMEEAIRNGTWVPPSPPTRPVKVDLSKKPVLWEAYIDGKGEIAGHSVDSSGVGGKMINDAWKTEQTRDWDTIKPFAAAYFTLNASPSTGVNPQTSGLATIPSVASLHSAPAAAADQESSPPTGPQSDVEATAGATTLPSPSSAANDSSSATPPNPAPSRTPRHRAILARARDLLNPTPNPTSPLPASLTRSNAGSNANLSGSAENGNATQMTELKQVPKVMRVAVLIAMPSPPSSSSGLSMSGRSSSSLASTAGPSSLSPSSSPSPRVSTTVPPTLRPMAAMPLDDDEHPLPHLEVGVADVVVVPTDYSGVGDRHHSEKKKAAQRGSLASMATGSEASEV